MNKKNKGKKGKYLVYAEKDLLKNSVWKPKLKNYRTDLVCSIREKLDEVQGLTEKFNTNSRYFGYWIGTNKDRAYIYVQKKGLRIDLNISPDSEKAKLEKEGFEVRFNNNFQGRAGWLTGWRVPHTTSIEKVMKWLLKAFNEDQ